jgi:peptidylprolyl isomerase
VITVPELEPLPALIVWILSPGTGPEIAENQLVTVQYVGVTWRDSKVFDSSWGSDQPSRFEIGARQVIPGMSKGLAGQRVGSRVVLVIPPDLAYGALGVGDAIGPDETLIFVVDLLAVSRPVIV